MFRIGAVLQADRVGTSPVGGPIVWLTGPSGAGKTTLAFALRDILIENGVKAIHIIDGDVLRAGLCSDLGFSESDKCEQTRRAAELARILSSLGVFTIVALISPYEESRRQARQICSRKFWFEVHVKCPTEECRRRDSKGLYAKLDAGEISGISGVDTPYEEPMAPSVVVDTSKHSIDECVDEVIRKMFSEGLLR